MTPSDKKLITYFDQLAPKRDSWKKRNWYYHQNLQDLFSFFILPGSTILEMGSGTGDLIASLNPKRGVGIDISARMVEQAQKKYPHLEWKIGDVEHLDFEEPFDYVILSDLIGHIDDIEQAFQELKKVSNKHTRIVVTYYNHIWEPLLRLAETLRLKAKQPLQNWISSYDVEAMLSLAGFEVVNQGKKMLVPIHISFLSSFINKFLGNLPLFSRLGLIQYFIARPIPIEKKGYSVSIIIPARNEKGNIERALSEIPDFGTMNEIIFVEGHSTDGTLGEIKRVAEAYGGKRNVRWAVQDGKGKGDAVRKGFAMAQGEVLMILDADLTVKPIELIKFYRAISSGRGEFINGCRLIYPLEKESMRFFNILGNKFFSLAFSWLLSQRIKDTLCGTKVLFKKDYSHIEKGRLYFGNFDPFGDFDLLFGAAKLNLKIVELPIRYQSRTYGETNIQRWRHGLLLLKMTIFAMRKLKFI
jgi:ubiquinone/menaquinone biosynthesis C-methylase UbiE